LVLIGWLAAFPLMAYAPLNLQRRLPDGIWVVLVILALMGLSQIRIRRILIMSKYWLSLSVLSSLIFLVGGSFSLTQAQAPVYRPIGEVQLFQYIQEVLPVNTIVLAQYSSANPLPAWAPVRTVIGHGPESAHLKDIQPKVDRFYNNEFSVDEEIGFLKEYGVKYVVITPQESQFEFRKYVDLGLFEMIYNHSGYILLKIN